MLELKASRSRDAEAVVVEARMDKGQGPIATVRDERDTSKTASTRRVHCVLHLHTKYEMVEAVCCVLFHDVALLMRRSC